MRELFDQEKLLSIVEKHKDELTSISSWNKYRKGKDLPHSQTLVSHFGSWNNLKKSLDLELNTQSRPLTYSDEDLYEILKENKEHFTTIKTWNSHAQQNDLPSYSLIMERLEPNDIYERTGIIARWTDEIIKDLMLKHFPSSPPTMRDWKELSDVENLPDPSTIARRFGKWSNLIHNIYS